MLKSAGRQLRTITLGAGTGIRTRVVGIDFNAAIALAQLEGALGPLFVESLKVAERAIVNHYEQELE